MSSSESGGGRVSSGQVVVGNQASLPPPSVPTTSMQTGGIKPLSGKPYFHVVLSKTHLSSRYGMGLSSNICKDLPSKVVPTILKYCGKSWDMIYNGQNKSKQFDIVGWRKFTEDNYLKLGDACVFELTENSKEKIVFEVQILRGDFPSEFSGIDNSEEELIVLSELPGTGESDSPFVID